MWILLLFISTVFFHIWDDFGRQGIMITMKQKSWWREQHGYKYKYRNDWIAALAAHSFSWAVMISLPSLIYCFARTNRISPALLFALFIQAAVHAYVDDLKCNKLKINLVEDQCIHLVQILAEVSLCWSITL